MLNTLLCTWTLTWMRLEHPLQELLTFGAHIVDFHLNDGERVLVFVSNKHFFAISSLKKIAIS